MRVTTIKCLECETILVSDYSQKKYESFVGCNCTNETSIENYFTISQPGTIVRAIDKSKVQALINDEWVNLGSTDDVKYTEWLGVTEGGGFAGNLQVYFNTEPMTSNECRTYLKKNNILCSEGRIYHVLKGIK